MKRSTTSFDKSVKLYKDGEINNYCNKFMFLLTNYISKKQWIPGISSRTHKINSIVMSPIMTNIAIP